MAVECRPGLVQPEEECRCSWVLVAEECRPWRAQQEEECRCSLVPAVVEEVAECRCSWVLVEECKHWLVQLAAGNRSLDRLVPIHRQGCRPQRRG